MVSGPLIFRDAVIGDGLFGASVVYSVLFEKAAVFPGAHGEFKNGIDSNRVRRFVSVGKLPEMAGHFFHDFARQSHLGSEGVGGGVLAAGQLAFR